MSEANGRGHLFEYVILHHPKSRKKDEPAKKSEILVDMKRVLVKDEQQAVILASRDIPETHLDKLEEVEIVVRPF